MTTETETVHSFADGFGVWHATVTFTEPVGPAWLDANIDRVRAKARRHIRKNIKNRMWPHSIGRVYVEVSANRLNSLNQMSLITYREKF